MVFSSPSFLFAFLPLALTLYLTVPARWRNVMLLVVSLLFYAYGEGWFTLLMLASITVNWAAALLIARAATPAGKKGLLAATITLDLAVLCFFKYAAFFVSEANPFLTRLGIPALPVPQVHLPLGISFFTFQAMSYVIDSYRGTVAAERSPLRVGLYIALFPQLIAGPIVRYGTIAAAIVRRRLTAASFVGGLRRFAVGLVKKVLIANTLAVTADRIFGLTPGELTTPLAWLGTACFIVQVYFDFSGYSDMAIGLGRMLGFRFLENFDYPYIGRSVREFWRRWHISLSTWFRDYLYIPLGGSRGGTLRTSLNLFFVFTLVGFWHGASWTYLVFGAIHGTLLALERIGLGRLLERGGALAGRLYFWAVIVFTFALFRAADMGQAFAFWRALCGAGAASGPSLAALSGAYTLPALLIGAVASLPVLPWMTRRFRTLRDDMTAAARARIDRVAGALVTALLVALVLASVIHGSMESYNPFVYFRF